MIFIWRGWGIMVFAIALVVTFAVGIPVQLLVEYFGLSRTFIHVGMSTGLVLAAAVNWMIGRRLNTASARNLIDAETGERVILRPQHSLFFIRMEYWSVPMVLLAIFMPIWLWTGG